MAAEVSMYDPENPQHMRHMRRHRASWSAEKEAALQEHFRVNNIGTPGWRDMVEKAQRASAEAYRKRWGK